MPSDGGDGAGTLSQGDKRQGSACVLRIFLTGLLALRSSYDLVLATRKAGSKEFSLYIAGRRIFIVNANCFYTILRWSYMPLWLAAGGHFGAH